MVGMVFPLVKALAVEQGEKPQFVNIHKFRILVVPNMVKVVQNANGVTHR